MRRGDLEAKLSLLFLHKFRDNHVADYQTEQPANAKRSADGVDAHGVSVGQRPADFIGQKITAIFQPQGNHAAQNKG